MPNEKFMYVFPQRDSTTGAITFLMSESHKKPAKGSPNPKVALGKNSGNWHFTFNIDNPEGLAVRFTADPLWVKEEFDPSATYTCPTKADTTNQIKAIQVHNDTQLTFLNLNNGKPRTLIYQLNMENDGVPCPLDPDIRNGGGTGPGIYYALVGAGVGLAAAFVLNNALLDVPRALLYVVGGAVAGYLVGLVVSRR